MFGDKSVLIELSLVNIQTGGTDHGQPVQEENKQMHAFLSGTYGRRFPVEGL